MEIICIDRERRIIGVRQCEPIGKNLNWKLERYKYHPVVAELDYGETDSLVKEASKIIGKTLMIDVDGGTIPAVNLLIEIHSQGIFDFLLECYKIAPQRLVYTLHKLNDSEVELVNISIVNIPAIPKSNLK
jgi:hypothetical protein